MLGVVELHDLAADCGLEGAIVVCIMWSVHDFARCKKQKRRDLQGRSGRVALPRVKVVLAIAARLVAEGAVALRAERTAELRKTAAEDMIDQCDCVRRWVQEQESNVESREQRAAHTHSFQSFTKCCVISESRGPIIFTMTINPCNLADPASQLHVVFVLSKDKT